jgi:hypothetical protein
MRHEPFTRTAPGSWLAIAALTLGACGPAASRPAEGARRPIAANASPPTSAVATRPAPKPCPREAPVIDSSCEGFEIGTSCLYAEDSVGCSCSETSVSERGEERPLTRVWRCGEHGELEGHG